MIDWLSENWYIVLFIAILVFVAVYGIMAGKVKEWLKFAVAEAERYLGSGIGQLKLRTVYDAFIDKYPAFSVIVPFSLFSYWVDCALEWLDKQLESNVNMVNYVIGDGHENK